MLPLAALLISRATASGCETFDRVPEIRRTPFFRFSLILIRAEREGAPPRASTTWASLDGQPLISLATTNPLQHLIDQHLARAGVTCPRDMAVNLLDTQIALVEAGEGMAIIPSFGLPVTRNRRVAMSQLVDPVVQLEYHQISARAKQPPPGAAEFTTFLKGYVARWAGRAGVV